MIIQTKNLILAVLFVLAFAAEAQKAPSLNVDPYDQAPDPSQPLISQGVGRRDPFSFPLYIITKLKALNSGTINKSRIDDNVEPLRRWALVTYTLVGVIWDVKNPKALIRDQQAHVHLVKVNDRIGYDNGIIKDIREGSITVLEDKTPQVLRLKK